MLKTFAIAAEQHSYSTAVNVPNSSLHWPLFRCPSLAAFGCPPKRPARDLLLQAILRTAFLHPSLKKKDLQLVEAELQTGDPKLFFAILSLVDEWMAWALDTALHHSETSYQVEHPLLVQLFLPLSEMLDLWGPEAEVAITHMRLAFIIKATHGDLPAEIDPAWIGGSLRVGRVIAEMLQKAKGDSEEREALLGLFGLKKKGRGPKIDMDRHLLHRMLYVRQRDNFPSDRQFFHALAGYSANLPVPLAKQIANIASWSRDTMTDQFKKVVLPILAARRPLEGTAIFRLLGRISPERQILMPEVGAKQK